MGSSDRSRRCRRLLSLGILAPQYSRRPWRTGNDRSPVRSRVLRSGAVARPGFTSLVDAPPARHHRTVAGVVWRPTPREQER